MPKTKIIDGWIAYPITVRIGDFDKAVKVDPERRAPCNCIVAKAIERAYPGSKIADLNDIEVYFFSGRSAKCYDAFELEDAEYGWLGDIMANFDDGASRVDMKRFLPYTFWMY